MKPWHGLVLAHLLGMIVGWSLFVWGQKNCYVLDEPGSMANHIETRFWFQECPGFMGDGEPE